MNISIVFFLSLAIVIVQTSGAGILSRSYQASQNSRGNSRIFSGDVDASGKSSKSITSSEEPSNKSGKGIGLSAWGIIGLIVGIIIISTSAYYAFIFYPYLCKKERKYDMIELASVV